MSNTPMNEWIRSALGRGPGPDTRPQETLLQEFYREEKEREAAAEAKPTHDEQGRPYATTANAGAGTGQPTPRW